MPSNIWLRLLGGTLIAFVVLVFAAALALFLLPGSMVKGYIESALGLALGHEVHMADLELDPGFTFGVRMIDLRIANANWAHEEDLARVGALGVSVELMSVFAGRLRFPEVTLRDPFVTIERDPDGRWNWSGEEDGDGGGAGGRAGGGAGSDFPTVGRLRIEDGTMKVRDAVRELRLEGRFATVDGRDGGADVTEFDLRGQVEDKPLKVAFATGAAASFLAATPLFPVTLDLVSGKTRIQADGSAANPVKLSRLDLKLDLRGPSLAETFALLRIPLPDTPPYHIVGDLRRLDDHWEFNSFTGTVGDSDLSGSLVLDQSGKRPVVNADLVSRKLDFDDLAGLIGAQPDTDETASAEQRREAASAEADGTVFPTTPVDDERLRAMDMDVTFKGKEVIANAIPVTELDMRIQLTDGRLLVRPLMLTVAGGQVAGEVALNARQEIPSADADLTFKGLDLKPFFKDTQFIQEMGGRFFGHLYLLGVGTNLDQMMANAEGEGWVGMRDGAISGLLVEAVGLDAAEALVLVIADDGRVPVRCGRIDLDSRRGLITARRAVIDTTDSLLVAKGTADLSAETLDLRVEALSKDFSVLDFSAPVSIKGKFSDPKIGIGGKRLIPLFRMGDAKNVDCDLLLSSKFAGPEDEGASPSNGKAATESAPEGKPAATDAVGQ